MNRVTLGLSKQPTSEPLHLKYRPRTLDEVLGQTSVVQSIDSLLSSPNCPHAFLFSGPSGVGKTTLSRIIARSLGCSPHNIIEVDAATHNGVDNVRALTSLLPYSGFGDSPNRMLILDECSRFSGPAWEALLKSIEEPPEHVYFAFCTTSLKSVPHTIQTRCAHFILKSLKPSDLGELIENICREERIDMPDEFIHEIVKYANGSARLAVMALTKANTVNTLDELKEVLDSILDEDAVQGLCRAITSDRPRWADVKKFTEKLKGENYLNVSISVSNYVAACVMNSQNEKDTVRYLGVLDAFSQKNEAMGDYAGLVLAIGRSVFANQ